MHLKLVINLYLHYLFQYFALFIQSLSRTIYMLKMLLIHIIVILSSQAYIFVFSNWKRTIAMIINAAGNWPTMPISIAQLLD